MIKELPIGFLLQFTIRKAELWSHKHRSRERVYKRHCKKLATYNKRAEPN